MNDIGTVLEGKYKILAEIGRGGMSIVYLAMDTHLNKQWAVKKIKKSHDDHKNTIVVNSLLAEAKLMTGLDHPALPRIVDIIDNDDTIYVVMDYIEGESLDKIIKRFGAQPEDLVIGWAKQLCDALSYLHGQKPPIIYRDMKPANVMLKPEGNVKIIDFGIAREYKEQALSDTTVLGTKGYAPPEQYSGQTDARSDIFALGMTMHHLLTGKDPRKTVYAPVRLHNPELSEGIEIIIDKCVQPAPENRYQSCQELLYDLEHPDLITRDYKNQQKLKLKKFMIAAIASVVFVVSGIGCRIAATSINNSDYDNLVSASTAASLEDKVRSYREAIEIYPERTDAYSAMLQAYEDEGVFSKTQNDEFLALYNKNKSKFDIESSEVAMLNYNIGKMYFNYYTEPDGSYNFSTRVQKAYSFFEENHKNGGTYDAKRTSECYYQICTFYKKYILNSASVEEASKESYEELFETINNTLDSMNDSNLYDQLALYNSIFMLVYDQRVSMMQVNIEQETLLDTLERVYNAAKDLTVNKEQSKKLQLEIVDNYQSYRDAISRVYENAKEKV